MQEKEDIRKELEGLGSRLGGLSRAMPYLLPEGYFNALPDRMLAAALDDAAVASLPKKHPFSVPEQYFEDLPAQLLEAAKQQEAAPAKVIPLGRRMWQQSRLAAAAVLFLLAGAGIFRVAFQQKSIDGRIAALPEEALTEYISQTATDLTGAALTAAGTTLPVHLTEEEITEYLDQTGWQ